MTVFFYICEYLNITHSEFFDIDSSEPEALRKLTEQLKRRIHNGDTVAPYTSEELHARISKSEQDYSEGRYTSHEDLFASLLDQNIQKAV